MLFSFARNSLLFCVFSPSFTGILGAHLGRKSLFFRWFSLPFFFRKSKEKKIRVTLSSSPIPPLSPLSIGGIAGQLPSEKGIALYPCTAARVTPINRGLARHSDWTKYSRWGAASKNISKKARASIFTLLPCGNRCRFGKSAIFLFAGAPPIVNKIELKFQTPRWRLAKPLRWCLTLSDTLSNFAKERQGRTEYTPFAITVRSLIVTYR